jgi:hypothetical protein
MSEQATQQGHTAIQGGSRPSVGPSIPRGRASSRLTIIGVGVAGALLTAAVIASVAMMTGSASAPVNTQVATVSAPSTVAQTSAVAPALVPAPVVAPAFSPVAAPAPTRPAPPLNAPGQCQIGQLQQLALDISATKKMEVGNVIRILSGSYVSPPILVTRSSQTVTFPAPPGSNGSARIIVEQKTVGGWTFEEEANGITSEVERSIDSHRDLILLRWTTPRC